MPQRIAPVEPPYDDQLAAWLNKWMPPAAQIAGEPLEPLALFRTLARHQSLTDRMRPLGAGILGSSTIDPVEREIVIDRTCARCGCEYEWGVHVASFGRLLGISEEKLMATATASAGDPVWSPRESLLVRLVDELHNGAHVSDELWSALSAHYSEAQLLELLVTIGFYHLISFVANGAAVRLEGWAARFPAAGTTE